MMILQQPEWWEWIKDGGIAGLMIIFGVTLTKLFLASLEKRDKTIKEIAEQFRETTEKGHEIDKQMAEALGSNTVVMQETKAVLGDVKLAVHDLKKSLNSG